MSEWISVKDELPEAGVSVMTKIDDGITVRNEGELKLVNNLWFLPNGSMYVYYKPTHWKAKEERT